MKRIATSFLLVGLALVTPRALADAAEFHTVAGTIQIAGTKVKTEGPKSQKEVVVLACSP